LNIYSCLGPIFDPQICAILDWRGAFGGDGVAGAGAGVSIVLKLLAASQAVTLLPTTRNLAWPGENGRSMRVIVEAPKNVARWRAALRCGTSAKLNASPIDGLQGLIYSYLHL
jgi:hypothetical protein